MQDYAIEKWSENNFIIKDGLVKVNHLSSPSLLEIVKEVRNEGVRGPLLIRFPHLVKDKIDSMYYHFKRAMQEYDYNGSFNAVFPLKVNQYHNFISHLIETGKEYGYGLEAGSKAELILALALNDKNAPITINGFKDSEMVSMAFIGAKMGHNITITIEGVNELEYILDLTKTLKDPVPNIGLRVRLHSSGVGIWAKSGGIDSKFGLTSTELIEAVELLKEHNLIEKFSMIHFHIGSQLKDIAPIKKALREAGNIYAELRKMGAITLNSINLGGGLAVEYSQNNNLDRNYTIEEFTNDVVFSLKSITEAKGVQAPNIFTESGRYVAANHAVLITPVLELFSQDYTAKSLRLKDKNPPLIEELNDLYNTLNTKYAKEYLHDSIDHMESLLTLFDLGYIDLEDRSNAEILVHLIIKKALKLLKDTDSPELTRLAHKLREKYLINASIFQSLPDFWGLKQRFPVMPIHNLDTKPISPASLWDITCDSDGEIDFSDQNPLYLHDIDVETEEYFLAFFLVGAYQEVLGMKHNLFTHPNEITVIFEENEYKIVNQTDADSILKVLSDMGYNPNKIKNILESHINSSDLIKPKEKNDILGMLHAFLEQNSYLRTTN